MVVEKVRDNLLKSAELLREFATRNSHTVLAAASVAVRCIREGGKLLICGNGGSASQALHFAAELTGRFEKERRPLPAIALTADVAALTAIGNDYGFHEVFAKQVLALGRKGDALVALSTSGKSANIVKAMEAAREIGIVTIGITGKGGGLMAALSDHLIDVHGERTYMIQETHLAVIHQMCMIIENAFAEGANS